MGDYCRDLTAHVIHSSLRTRGLTATGVLPYYLLRVLAPLATPSVYTVQGVVIAATGRFRWQARQWQGRPNTQRTTHFTFT